MREGLPHRAALMRHRLAGQKSKLINKRLTTRALLTLGPVSRLAAIVVTS
jgi:hypothetical protein